MVQASQHDEFAASDFIRLRQFDMRTVREGVSWHLIESTPNQFDFSSALQINRAAEEAGTEIIGDLLHFGWPDHID